MASNSRLSHPGIDKNGDTKNIMYGISKVTHSRKSLMPNPINKNRKNSESQSTKLLQKPGKENDRNKEETEKVKVQNKKEKDVVSKSNRIISNMNNIKDGIKIIAKEAVKNNDDKNRNMVSGANAPTKRNQLLIAVAENSNGQYLSLEKGRKHSNLASPFALPENVICIDDHADSSLCYNPDYITYLRSLELKQQIKPVSIAFKVTQDKRQLNARSQLSDWLVEVCHYFNVGQECLYQTINLLDRILSDSSRMRFSSKDMQLVGISCLLIATKLEEYYPADLKELSRLTQNSWKPIEIVQMELKILQAINFKSISVDPVPFLHRCISAARRSLFLRASYSPIDDEIFYELCIFNVDCLIMDYRYWELIPSMKASAAVYAALIVFMKAYNEIQHVSNSISDNVFRFDSNSVNDACSARKVDLNNNHPNENRIWNPTLVYYSGYSESNIKKLSSKMLQILLKVKMNMEKDDSEKSTTSSLIKKFTSVSRHRALLKRPELSVNNVKLSISYIN